LHCYRDYERQACAAKDAFPGCPSAACKAPPSDYWRQAYAAKGGFPQIFRLPCRICLPQYKSNKKYKIAKKNVPKYEKLEPERPEMFRIASKTELQLTKLSPCRIVSQQVATREKFAK